MAQQTIGSTPYDGPGQGSSQDRSQAEREELARLYPPLPYHQLHRAGERGWWRSLVGTLLLVLGMVVVGPVVWLVPFVVGFVLDGRDVATELESMLDLGDPTPLGLAYLMLALGSLIPITWFLTRVLHGLKPRWTTSVGPRLRWRWFAASFGIAVVALIATLVVGVLLPSQGVAPEPSTDVNEFTDRTLDFLLVVLLLTPLQAAGEEYAFRGYLTQALGGLFRSTWFAVLLPALVFALAHGVGQSLPVFFDRFAFGVVAGLLVVLTGGLEAPIAMHVLNNWLAFGLAIAFGDLGSSLNPTGGTWWSIPVTLTQSLVFLGLSVLVAPRMGVETHADPGVLVASRGRVYGLPAAPAGPR